MNFIRLICVLFLSQTFFVSSNSSRASRRREYYRKLKKQRIIDNMPYTQLQIYREPGFYFFKTNNNNNDNDNNNDNNNDNDNYNITSFKDNNNNVELNLKNHVHFNTILKNYIRDIYGYGIVLITIYLILF